MNILIFRRDLRLFDNTAFLYLVEKKIPIIPLFIFDPRQKMRTIIQPHHNVDFNRSLKDLSNILKKRVKNYNYLGLPQVLEEIFSKYEIHEVAVNEA